MISFLDWTPDDVITIASNPLPGERMIPTVARKMLDEGLAVRREMLV